jgi:hypothetical protein
MKMWTEKVIFLQITEDDAVGLWKEIRGLDYPSFKDIPLLKELWEHLGRATYDTEEE